MIMVFPSVAVVSLLTLLLDATGLMLDTVTVLQSVSSNAVIRWPWPIGARAHCVTAALQLCACGSCMVIQRDIFGGR